MRPPEDKAASSSENFSSRHPLLRYLLLLVGWLSLLLGSIGIFVPLLPTTPFLLLAAACFLRSSERLYRWLLSHPRLGPYIEGYLSGRGIPKRAKWYSLLLMWPSLLFSGFVLLDGNWGWLLVATGVAVSTYILRQPTLAAGQESA